MNEAFAAGGAWTFQPTALDAKGLAYCFIYSPSDLDQGVRLMVILPTKTINNGKDSSSRRI